MLEQKLITAIENLTVSVDNLKESVDSLHTIHNDIFNTDTSHDDIVSLKGKLQKLIDTINSKL